MTQTLESLAFVCKALGVPEAPGMVTGVSIDTRTLKQGQVFFCIKGPRFDGHEFAGRAQEAGAVAVVSEKPLSLEVPVLQVPDATAALGDLARAFALANPIATVGVTGSVGKTTVKHFLGTLLSALGPVNVSRGNLNNCFGVPLSILQRQSEHGTQVLEMGANHAGEISHLAGLCPLQVAVITCVEPAHLEGFGSVEGIAQAKAEIAQGLMPGGTLVIDGDQTWYEDLEIPGVNIVRVGERYASDYQICHMKPTASGMQFRLNETELEIPLGGAHQVKNAAKAYAAALVMGVPPEAAAEKLKQLSPVPGRLILHQTPEALVIDDTYNASPASVRAALDMLRRKDGQKIFVFGDMLEMGKHSQKLHAELAPDVLKAGVHVMVALGDYAHLAGEQLVPGSVLKAPSLEGVVALIKEHREPGASILVKGSRSMGLESVVNALVGAHAV